MGLHTYMDYDLIKWPSFSEYRQYRWTTMRNKKNTNQNMATKQSYTASFLTSLPAFDSPEPQLSIGANLSHEPQLSIVKNEEI